jgi:hypothetical protein
LGKIPPMGEGGPPPGEWADGRPGGRKWPVGWSRRVGVSGKKWGKSRFGRRWWHRGCSEEALGNAEIS